MLDKDDIPPANVSDLTEAEKHGRELFGQRCANCHTLKASNAIAEVGPDLDTLRPNKALVLDAIKDGKSNGNGQMAAGLYTGQDADDVAAYVAKAVGSPRGERRRREESGGRRGGRGGGRGVRRQPSRGAGGSCRPSRGSAHVAGSLHARFRLPPEQVLTYRAAPLSSRPDGKRGTRSSWGESLSGLRRCSAVSSARARQLTP